MAIDEQVLREQVTKAFRHLEQDTGISTQRKLNFEMSVKNLFQIVHDRERVPKIQGLLNECMTFLDDELSVITARMKDLLSLEEVIEQELILFVTLNVNKNTEPVARWAKCCFKICNSKSARGTKARNSATGRTGRSSVSYWTNSRPLDTGNFPQILQTARGTNTAFLFSMQSLPQLMHVGRGFQRGCGLRAEHHHDSANPRRGNGGLFSAGLGGASRHAPQPVHGAGGRSSDMNDMRRQAGRLMFRPPKRVRSTSTSRTCRKVRCQI